jgi:hypothetical protein
MKTFKVIVQMEDDGSLGQCEAIEHDGRVWLVPYWLESPTRAETKPSRIIPLDILQHQKLSAGNPYSADFILNDPMPRNLFDEKISPQLAKLFQVVEAPDIVIPAGGGRAQ